jgi:hypothetical protein
MHRQCDFMLCHSELSRYSDALNGHVSISGKFKVCFSTSQGQDPPWGPHSLLSNGHWGGGSSLLGVKRLGLEADHLHVVPRSRIVELYLHSPICLRGEVLGMFLFATVSRLALLHIQWVVSQGLKRSGREADFSPPLPHTSSWRGPQLKIVATLPYAYKAKQYMFMAILMFVLRFALQKCICETSFKFSACSSRTPRRRMAEWR